MIFHRQTVSPEGERLLRVDSARADREWAGVFGRCLGVQFLPPPPSPEGVRVLSLRETVRLVGNAGLEVEWDGEGPAAVATVFVHGQARAACAFLTGVNAEADNRTFERLAGAPHPYRSDDLAELYGEFSPDPAGDFPGREDAALAPRPSGPAPARPLLVVRVGAADAQDEGASVEALNAATCLAAAFFEALGLDGAAVQESGRDR